MLRRVCLFVIIYICMCYGALHAEPIVRLVFAGELVHVFICQHFTTGDDAARLGLHVLRYPDARPTLLPSPKPD